MGGGLCSPGLVTPQSSAPDQNRTSLNGRLPVEGCLPVGCLILLSVPWGAPPTVGILPFSRPVRHGPWIWLRLDSCREHESNLVLPIHPAQGQSHDADTGPEYDRWVRLHLSDMTGGGWDSPQEASEGVSPPPSPRREGYQSRDAARFHSGLGNTLRLVVQTSVGFSPHGASPWDDARPAKGEAR